MSDKRSQLRVAVQYRLTVRHAGLEGRGETENLSERGAMLSVDLDPPLRPGDTIELDLDLDGHVVTIPATVRWISTVLPGMTGVEFTPPVLPELLDHFARLLDERVDEAQGF